MKRRTEGGQSRSRRENDHVREREGERDDIRVTSVNGCFGNGGVHHAADHERADRRVRLDPVLIAAQKESGQGRGKGAYHRGRSVYRTGVDVESGWGSRIKRKKSWRLGREGYTGCVDIVVREPLGGTKPNSKRLSKKQKKGGGGKRNSNSRGEGESKLQNASGYQSFRQSPKRVSLV